MFHSRQPIHAAFNLPQVIARQRVAIVARMAPLWLALLTSTACVAEVKARVVGVTDGDTVVVLLENREQRRVRLAGIDAPEKHQPFGNVSKRSLSDCAYGKSVTLHGNKTDRYGRLVAKVVADGVDCNLNQITLGVAWHYKQYQKEQSWADRDQYSEHEVSARERRIGLWRDPAPIPPWEFRKLRLSSDSTGR